MIYNVGLLPCKHITTALDEAYSLYRRKDRASHPHDPESLAFRAKYDCWHPDIRFLGCFDTVGRYMTLLCWLQQIVVKHFLSILKVASVCHVFHGTLVDHCVRNKLGQQQPSYTTLTSNTE